jgi:hypothetical protein
MCLRSQTATAQQIKDYLVREQAEAQQRQLEEIPGRAETTALRAGTIESTAMKLAA